MHIFLDNVHQVGKYSDQIARHQAEFKREFKFTNQKYISISSLQTDYLSLESSWGYGYNFERENIVQKNCTFCGSANHSAEICFKIFRKEKEKSRVAGDSDEKFKERTPRKCLDLDLKIT